MLSPHCSRLKWPGSFLLLFLAMPAHAEDTTQAGEFIIEPPTLVSLGFEWYIDGDDNRNAEVALAYRKTGDANWRDGLPLLRVHNERSVFDQTLDYTAPNMFAGSIFYLEPGTEYEARFTMTDPDGVRGRAERIVTVTTRAEPEAFAGGRELHVYPLDHTGPEEEPAFHGLLQAYYMAGLGGDWSRASAARVRPGDTILVPDLLSSRPRPRPRPSLLPSPSFFHLSIDGRGKTGAGTGRENFGGGDRAAKFGRKMGRDFSWWRSR